MSNIFTQPLTVFFAAAQRGLKPLRLLGRMGTPDEPLYYEAGSVVPWWIFCRWPMNLKVTFHCDCETYYEDGEQMVRPLWGDDHDYIIKAVFADESQKGGYIHLSGAPTSIWLYPRHRPPQKRTLELSLA